MSELGVTLNGSSLRLPVAAVSKMGEEGWYQCKVCHDKFKTTAELQKHNRLNHRNPSKNPQPPKQNGHGGSAGNKNEALLDESSGTGDHLNCGSCHFQFDTSDPVVLHLLRQNACENGAFKCPYCVKVQLRKSDVLIDKAAAPEPKGDMEPRRSPYKNLSMRRRSRSWSTERARKRTSSLRTPLIEPKRQTIVPSTPVSSIKSSVTPSPSTPSTPQVTRGRVTTRAATTPTASESKRYELMYKRPRGGGPGGGKGTRGGQIASRKSQVSPVDPPLRVSVLINENPFPSDSRLAVPKTKHYEKGNIKCQYCGFLANSIREIQFHINTHLPKSYPCEFCPAIYRSKQGVTKHTARNHPEELGMSKKEGNKGLDMEDDDNSNYSSSMTSDAGDTFDLQSSSNFGMDEDSSNLMAAASHYQQVGANYTNGYDELQFSSYFSLPQVQHPDFVGVGQSLEKVVDLANF